MEKPILPTFFLCGAPKAGTTSLHEYCARHPEVCMSRPKETGFFFENYERGLDWFSEQYFSHYEGESEVGESSAGNMLHQEVAPRIKKHCPDAKLIFILRDPVERIWSHYRFDINVGTLPPTADFSELIRDEANEWRKIMVDLGMYHEQLVHYADHFDEEQMRILLFEDFAKNTEDVVGRLFEFVGVDPKVGVGTEEAHNETSHLRNPALYQMLYRVWEPIKQRLPRAAREALFGVRSTVRGWFFQSNTSGKPVMLEDDRQYLGELYARPNAELEAWIGRDLSHWT